nr:DUF4123 domain-containing protein [uncultured Duganella sp.]
MSSSYILIDTTLIGYPDQKPWTKKHGRPSWVVAMYEQEAIQVSPILVDVDRAWHCDRIDATMALVNAEFPQLGISFIETALSLTELQAHLRQFIYIVTQECIELTLRFADCAVLSALAAFLTDEQWASLVAPFDSWMIHDRDGKLKALPIIKLDRVASVPLSLSDAQISSLTMAFDADQLIANVRKMRPERESEYSNMQAHQYAEQVCQLWRSGGTRKIQTFCYLLATFLRLRDVCYTIRALLRYWRKQIRCYDAKTFVVWQVSSCVVACDEENPTSLVFRLRSFCCPCDWVFFIFTFL